MLGTTFPQVLTAARVGADWAWARIYDDLSPQLLGYLRARGAHDAEDVLGEVFLQVVRDLHRFHGDEQAFRAWVFVVAHHRLIDEARRRSRRPVEPTADLPEAGTAPDAVETQVLQSTSTERVRRIIEQLAPDQRDVLLLRVLGDLTVEQVAGVVGKRVGAVKALQRRGLAAIERALAQEGVPL